MLSKPSCIKKGGFACQWLERLTCILIQNVIKEAPGGSVLPCSLNIMHRSPQIPEKILSSLKAFSLAPQIPNINSASPKSHQNIRKFSLKCILSLRRIKFTYLRTMKLYTSTWLNVHLIVCVIYVKTGLSNRIHDI